jgi:hypothetical protein
LTCVIIGGATDASTPETDKLNTRYLTALTWKSNIEMVLNDSTYLNGQYEGMVGGDSSNSILPDRDETIEVCFINNNRQKYYFRSFYYQISNYEILPVFRLRTTGDDVIQNLHECRCIIRANGDSTGVDSILHRFSSFDYGGHKLLLRDPGNLIAVTVERISAVSILKNKKALETGLLIGVIIDALLYVWLRWDLQHNHLQ